MAEFVPTLGDAGPNSAELDRIQPQIWSKSGQNLPIPGQSWSRSSHIGHCRAKLASICPKSGQIWLDRFCTCSTDSRRNLTYVGKILPRLGQIWPDLTEKVARFRRDFARAQMRASHGGTMFTSERSLSDVAHLCLIARHLGRQTTSPFGPQIARVGEHRHVRNSIVVEQLPISAQTWHAVSDHPGVPVLSNILPKGTLAAKSGTLRERLHQSCVKFWGAAV